MTDTTTLDEPSDGPGGAAEGEELPELVETPVLGGGGTASDSPVKTRFLLPILLPLLSMLAVAVLVLNISRVFLAGDEDSAVVIGVIVTLCILVGSTVIAAMPRLRTSSLALVLGGALVFVSFAGLLTLGPSLTTGEGGATGYKQPPGPAVGSVDVVAEASIKFNATEFTAPAGVVQINYSGATGHTLAIDDPKFSSLLLTTDAGGPKSEKVLLTPGKYVIYCTVPGHRAQGMQATITVAAK
jgi:plastocyanin